MSNSGIEKPVRRRAPVAMEDCGAARASDIIADRWAFLIIREVFYGVQRYDDIRADIGIPRSVLTTRLKQLVEHGILDREPYREAGARTRYGYILTPAGRDLALTIIALMQWGDQHLKGGESALDIMRRSDGAPVKVAFVEASVDEVPLMDIQVKPRKARP